VNRARVLVVDAIESTRRLVRRHLEAAGHEANEAASTDEALELALRFVPQLVLAEAAGIEIERLARTLRGTENLKDVPLVLVTALPSDRAAEAGAAIGALDVLGKPFAPEALAAVVAHALEPKREPAEDPFAEARAATDADRERRANDVWDELGRFLAAMEPSVLRDDVAWASHRPTPSAVLTLTEELGRHAAGGEVALRGRLEHVALGEVLQMLQHLAHTGVLHVEAEDTESSGPRAVQICLRDGRVDLALARGVAPEFLLGRYLVAEGAVEPSDLERLVKRGGADARLGQRMVKLGYIAREDLDRALARQTNELVYEALRWPRGRFAFFRYATRPEADEARLAMPVTAILMEGLRRVDEWRLIAEQVTSFDLVPEIDRRALGEEQRARMSAEERAVLDAIDGRRDVRTLVELTRLGSFDVCKILYQLLSARLVRA
jgi:CheY-like chemotaxis protein